jgi:hypothetical protein
MMHKKKKIFLLIFLVHNKLKNNKIKLNKIKIKINKIIHQNLKILINHQMPPKRKL